MDNLTPTQQLIYAHLQAKNLDKHVLTEAEWAKIEKLDKYAAFYNDFTRLEREHVNKSLVGHDILGEFRNLSQALDAQYNEVIFEFETLLVKDILLDFKWVEE